jgi:hypothetical protein
MKTTRWVLVLGLILALCALAIGKPASALDAVDPTIGTIDGPDVTPEVVSGNPTCTDLGYDYGFKPQPEPPPTGSYTEGPLTVNINSDGTYFSWTSNIGVDAVIVKGGNLGANSFVYDPPAESKGDDGLYSPDTASGEPAAISHIEFCYDVENNLMPLKVEKTAEGTFDREISWGLEKTVDPASHSGLAGDSFESTWTVKATKKEEDSNYKVTGDITITNPNAQAVDFSVSDTLSDGTVAAVDCDSATDGNQSSGQLAANGTAECSYTASPLNNSASSNTATVTSNTQGVGGGSDTADIMWTANVIGDEQVTLADPRFNFSKLISSTTEERFIDNTFTCPTDKAAYTTNPLVTQYKNVATLTGDSTNLSKDATVTVTCKYPWVDETATGQGLTYRGATGLQSWFMYTPYTTAKVDLIAGQNYDAGDIYFTRGVTTTTIEITLADAPVKFRWAKVAENLKVQDFKTAPTKFVQPGAFKYKKTCDQAQGTCSITVPNANFYGIHADVERYVG